MALNERVSSNRERGPGSMLIHRPVSRIKPGSGAVGHSAEFGEIFGFAIVARRRILQNTDDMGSSDATAGQALLGAPPSLVRVSAEHGLAGQKAVAAARHVRLENDSLCRRHAISTIDQRL